MIVLDTNVVSELLRPAPAPAVEAWLAGQDGADIYLTAISEAELRYGVAIMANGKRQKLLAEAVDGMLREDFHDRIPPFDSAAAGEYARIGAERRAAGRPISRVLPVRLHESSPAPRYCGSPVHGVPEDPRCRSHFSQPRPTRSWRKPPPP
jgi:hypothetical protein